VHHRTIQINHQPDATIFQFIILTFIYSSTCFGRSPAHHQVLNDCSSSPWFYLCIVVIAVLLVVVGPAEHHCYHHDTKVKPGAATAVIELLMMGGRTPDTWWAVNNRQDNKPENCCIWLVIYLNISLFYLLQTDGKNWQTIINHRVQNGVFCAEILHTRVCSYNWPCQDMHNLKKNQGILTAIHLLRITCSIVRRCVGSMHSIPRINSFASWATFFHSGSGKSYCPVRIRFFMPGEMASPWLL